MQRFVVGCVVVSAAPRHRRPPGRYSQGTHHFLEATTVIALPPQSATSPLATYEGNTTQLLDHDENGPPVWMPGPGLLESVWRYKLIVLLISLVGLGLGFFYASQQPLMYEASARLLIAAPESSGLYGSIRPGASDAQRYIANQAELLGSLPVSRRAAEISGLQISPEELHGLLEVEAAPAVDVITVSVTYSDPERAALLANAVAAAYEERTAEDVQTTADRAIEELEERRQDIEDALRAVDTELSATPEDVAVLAQRDALGAELQSVMTGIRELHVDATLFGSGVEVREDAAVPQLPTQPRPRRSAALGLALGGLVGAASAWGLNTRKARLNRAPTADDIFGVPLLGSVPDFRKTEKLHGVVPIVEAPRSSSAEAIHFVTASITFLMGQYGRRVMVTSALAGEGKTVITANIAAAATSDGRSVVLFDADNRAHGLTDLVDGLPGVVDGDHRIPVVPQGWASASWRFTSGGKITILRPDTAIEDPASYYRSSAFSLALRQVSNYADFLLIDAPPVLAVADAGEIVQHVDGVVLVFQRDTGLEILAAAKKKLALFRAPLIGLVENRVVPGPLEFPYGQPYGRASTSHDYSPPSREFSSGAARSEGASPRSQDGTRRIHGMRTANRAKGDGIS